MARIVCAYGTRPEQIKLRPVIDALTDHGLAVVHWWSGQSRNLVGGNLPTDYHPISWADLHTGIAGVLREFPKILAEVQPDAVLVQGDTATAFAVALASFLARVPIGHVEAGLRTYGSEPWPEEAFRRAIAPMAKWHFCPDDDARKNVMAESTRLIANSSANAVVVGNTVIDTLPIQPFRVLVTLHRRENQGRRILGALWELDQIAESDVQVDVIRHPNLSAWWTDETPPEVVFSHLRWLDPMDHSELIQRLGQSEWAAVVTDSGGLQEEAAHFGIPCLVFRTSTERVALVWNGAVKLSPPDDPRQLRAWLDNLYRQRRTYGDGSAGSQIARILKEELCPRSDPTPPIQTSSPEPSLKTLSWDDFQLHATPTVVMDTEILGASPT